MKNEAFREDEIVDRACAAIRQEAEGLDMARADAALERVRLRLGVTPDVEPGKVLGCSDIQRLLPAFLAGTLAHDRELLIADHTRTCIACRRALKTLEAGDREAAPAAAAAPSLTSRVPRWAWAAAAAVVLVLGLQFAIVNQFWPGAQGGAVLRVLQGAVIGLADSSNQAYSAGAEVPYGQELLTPRGQTTLIRLADGSTVELRERTRFSVLRRRGGTTLALEGGNVIVEAAKQEEGKHLWVETGDANVQVVGTVFAVNAGTRGSRISVYEGQVHVAQAGRDQRVLRPGQQATTSQRVRHVPLEAEVAWSSRKDQHLALLGGAALLQREMADLPRPEKRFQSALLDRLPAGTIFFAALPNLSQSVDAGLQRLQARLAGDPELASALGDPEDLAKLSRLVESLAGLGNELGDELIATAWVREDRKVIGPVAAAEVANPGRFRALLEAEIAKLREQHPDLPVHIVDDPATVAAAEDALYVWVGPGVMAIACDADALQGIAAALSGASGAFRDGDFHAAVAERYSHGVDGLLAVDLGGILARTGEPASQDKLARLGLSGVRHLLVEQWVEAEHTRRQAVLAFAGQREGIASWLAAPAPMGALGFVSPEATTVMSFVAKEPTLLIQDVLAALTAEERAQWDTDRSKFVAEHGWDPIADLAEPLGGEFVFALDGPLAPEPSWKVVVEVYDPARLQNGLERLVADLDGELRKEGKGTVTIAEAGDGTWVITSSKTDGPQLSAYYRFEEGYLVATPSAALLERSLKYRAAGQGLLQSAKLRNLLPPDAQVNLSALWYSDFSALAGLLGSAAGAAQGQLPPEMKRLVDELGQAAGPTVVFAYGEADSIRVSSSSPKSALSLADFFLLRGMDLASIAKGHSDEGHADEGHADGGEAGHAEAGSAG
jgi:hypothetical protein